MKTNIKYSLLLFSIIFLSCQDNQKDLIEKKKNSLKKETHSFSSNLKSLDIEESCGYNYNFKKMGVKVKTPNKSEIESVNEIFSYSGIPSNFIIYEAEIENAIATIIDEQRYIIYDPNLFKKVNVTTNSYWSSISILAHEIGHHLSGHTLLMKSGKLKSELEADKYSGFVLYKMGATLNQALLAIKKLGSNTDNKTHPSISKRINAIKDGWNQANTQRYEAALPPPPDDKGFDYTANDFKSPMLINREHIAYAEEIGSDYYKEYAYLYGTITEVDDNYEFFKIRIQKTSNKFIQEFRDITNEDWTVVLDEIEFLGENEMCHFCADNFKGLITPGRRLKFSIVESYPGGGTSTHGVWFLNYAKGIGEEEI